MAIAPSPDVPRPSSLPLPVKVTGGTALRLLLVPSLEGLLNPVFSSLVGPVPVMAVNDCSLLC